MNKRMVFILVTIGILLFNFFGCGMHQRKPPGKKVVQTQEKPGTKLPKEIVGKDGAPMVLIPAGEFQMGDHFNGGDSDERPVHTISPNYEMLIEQLDDRKIVGFFPRGFPKRKCDEAYNILRDELKKKPSDSPLVDLLMEAVLGSQSPRIRFYSTLLLGKIRTESIPSILEIVLDTDKDANVRKSAAYVIGTFRKERSIPILAEALSDQSLDVRASATTALGEIGRSATPILVKMMEKELAREKTRTFISSHLTSALAGTKDRRAIGVLVRGAAHKNHFIRGDSVSALTVFAMEGRKYGRDRKVFYSGPPVDPIYEVREADRRKSEQVIARALVDAHEDVRGSAERAMESITRIKEMYKENE